MRCLQSVPRGFCPTGSLSCRPLSAFIVPQKMLYPYLPEPMRNQETFEWMLRWVLAAWTAAALAGLPPAAANLAWQRWHARRQRASLCRLPVLQQPGVPQAAGGHAGAAGGVHGQPCGGRDDAGNGHEPGEGGCWPPDFRRLSQRRFPLLSTQASSVLLFVRRRWHVRCARVKLRYQRSACARRRPHRLTLLPPAPDPAADAGAV